MAYRRARSAPRSRGRSRSPRRQTTWVRYYQSGIPGVGTAGNHPFFVLDQGIDPGAQVGATVTRVRAVCNLLVGSLTNSYGAFFIGFGVVPRDTPAESFPHPYSDANKFDWMYWAFHPIASNTVGVFSVTTTDHQMAVDIDIKSQRKLMEPADTLAGMFQIVSVASTPTPVLTMSVSTLLKLS